MELPEELDVVGSSADESRLAELGFRVRGWRGSFFTRRRRALQAIAAGLVVVLGGGYAWIVAHPGPVRVPSIVVALEPGSAVLPDTSATGIASDATAVRLALTVQTTDPGDLRIRLLGITAPGLATVASPEVTSSNVVHLWMLATVRCPFWTGATPLRATVEISDGDRRRGIDLPVDPTGLGETGAVIDRRCVAYNAVHPLRVEGLSSGLDPTLPILHLDWTIRNPTESTVTIDALGGTGAATLAFHLAGNPTPLQVPAGAVVHVRNELVVDSCRAPEDLQPGAVAQAGLTMPLLGVTEFGPTRIDLPADLMTTIAPQVARACSGAPGLTDTVAEISASGAPDRWTGTIKVALQISGTGTWMGAVQSDAWSGIVGPESAQPFADVRDEVVVPGSLELSGPWRAPTCALLQAFGSQPSIKVTLTAARVFPYWIPVAQAWSAQGCQPFHWNPALY